MAEPTGRASDLLDFARTAKEGRLLCCCRLHPLSFVVAVVVVTVVVVTVELLWPLSVDNVLSKSPTLQYPASHSCIPLGLVLFCLSAFEKNATLVYFFYPCCLALFFLTAAGRGNKAGRGLDRETGYSPGYFTFRCINESLYSTVFDTEEK